MGIGQFFVFGSLEAAFEDCYYHRYVCFLLIPSLSLLLMYLGFEAVIEAYQSLSTEQFFYPMS